MSAFVFHTVLSLGFLKAESPVIPRFPTAVIFLVSFFLILEFNPEIFGNIVIDTFFITEMNLITAILVTTGVLAVVKGYRQVDFQGYVVVSFIFSIIIRLIKWAEQG